VHNKQEIKQEDIQIAKQEQNRLDNILTKALKTKNNIQSQHNEIHNKAISIEVSNKLNKGMIMMHDNDLVKAVNSKEASLKQYKSKNRNVKGRSVMGNRRGRERVGECKINK